MSCQLVLENYIGSYCPGNAIEGKVICVFTEEDNMQDVKLALYGEESTEWTDIASYFDVSMDRLREDPVRHYGNHRIIEMARILTDSEHLGPCTFEYPFTILLPKHLPDTFKGTYGKVSYYLQATVEIFGDVQHEHVEDIIIEGPVDLNDIPNLNMNLVEYSEDKEIVNLCCASSGLASLDVFLSKEGFVKEEIINVSVTVRNGSDEDVDQVILQLNRVITEKVTTPKSGTKTDSLCIDSKTGEGVRGGKQKSYNFQFKVPYLVMIHNLWNCKLFKEWFIIKITAELKGDQGHLMIDVPLIIGHIPFSIIQREEEEASVLSINIPAESSYGPPTFEEFTERAMINHMRVPGETPYPPLPYQGEDNPIPERVNRRYETNGEDTSPPPYEEAVENPDLYPCPS